MLDLTAIAARVDRGIAGNGDASILLDEVRRLYGQPTPPAVLALEQAQQAEALATAAALRAADSARAAQAEAEAAAKRAATAQAVTAAMQKVADEKAAAERAASDKALADAEAQQRAATAKDLKTQLEAVPAGGESVPSTA